MTSSPPTGSLRRDTGSALASNPVGVVPAHWDPQPEPRELLAEVVRLGFDGIQAAPQLPHGAELRRALDSHGLRLAEVYVALPCTRQGPTSAAREVGRGHLAALQEAGGEILVAAVDGTPDRDATAGRAGGAAGLSDGGWARLLEFVDELAAETVAAGAVLAFHPHAGTYVETPDEIAILLEGTDPGTVHLCVDTGHDLVGGGDPAGTITAAADRVSHVHVKDVDPDVLASLRSGRLGGLEEAVDRRLFCPLGSGLLDLAGVLTALAGVGYDGWLMVEQDSTWEPPAEAFAISRRVLELVKSQPKG